MKFGALSLPAALPTTDGKVSVDPAVDVLADAAKAILMYWLNDAWSVIAPNEPFIRTVLKSDPEKASAFQEGDLPALYVFSKTMGSTRIADAVQEAETNISFLWVQPPGQYGIEANWGPVFMAYAKAIAAIVKKERHPVYVHADDQGELPSVDDDPEGRIRMMAAQAYGTDIRKKCGFVRWHQPARDACVSTHIRIHQGEKVIQYEAFLAHIIACEWLRDDDPAQDGFVPTGLQATTNTGGDDPLTTFGFDEPATP